MMNTAGAIVLDRRRREVKISIYDWQAMAFQSENLLIAYKERFDKDNFIKNLLLDNLLLVDIYNRAKKATYRSERQKGCIYTGDQSEQRLQSAGMH